VHDIVAVIQKFSYKLELH